MTRRFTCDVCGSPIDIDKVRGQCLLHRADGLDVSVTVEFPISAYAASQLHLCSQCVGVAERALQGQADRYNDEG